MAFQFVDGTKILEKNMARNLNLQKIIFTYYRPIVKKEVELAQVRLGQKVLCVGGGYFPATAILFHQLSGAKVTVIDNDIEAVESAHKLVVKLGLEHFVTVIHSDGIHSSSGDFDVIHIAMQVSPKEEVFHQLRTTLRDHAKLLIRTPKQHLERGYQPFQEMTETWVTQVRYSNIQRTMLYVR